VRLLSEVTATFSALTTTTKSPVSAAGVYMALCLPLRIPAISEARRPSGRPEAATRCQARSMSPDLGVYVLCGLMSSSVSCHGRGKGILEGIDPGRERLLCYVAGRSKANS